MNSNRQAMKTGEKRWKRKTFKKRENGEKQETTQERGKNVKTGENCEKVRKPVKSGEKQWNREKYLKGKKQWKAKFALRFATVSKVRKTEIDGKSKEERLAWKRNYWKKRRTWLIFVQFSKKMFSRKCAEKGQIIWWGHNVNIEGKQLCEEKK